MFIGEALHAFQFDNEHAFDEDIGIVFSNVLALIVNGERRLRSSLDATKREFPKQATLVHLFEESGAQGIGDLQDGGYHALRERIWTSAFIGVHRRLI